LNSPDLRQLKCPEAPKPGKLLPGKTPEFENAGVLGRLSAAIATTNGRRELNCQSTPQFPHSPSALTFNTRKTCVVIPPWQDAGEVSNAVFGERPISRDGLSARNLEELGFG
jgi:hypothetical protein